MKEAVRRQQELNELYKKKHGAGTNETAEEVR